MDNGEWPNLSVERQGKLWTIAKPLSKFETMISADWFLPGSFQTGPSHPSKMATGVRTSFVTIGCDEHTEPSPDKMFDHPSVELLEDLLAWMRVLTGQYWIGYADKPWSETYVSINALEDGQSKGITNRVGFGHGFVYGRNLDKATWQVIESRLATGAKPTASRFFFCDALRDIAERNVTQAVVALGIACEIEVQGLVGDIVARQDPVLQSLFENHVKATFQQMISKLIKNLGGEPLSESEPRAAQLVCALYEMRGQAAHHGACKYHEGEKTASVNLNSMPTFVDAVERLFAWSDEQRSKVGG